MAKETFLRFCKLSFLFLFFSQCSLADLRPPILANAGSNPELKRKAHQILENPVYPELTPDEWKNYKSVQFILTDIWKSKFVRFFTPIKEDEQRLRVYLDFERDAMEVEFLSGPKKGFIIGLSKKEPYQIASDTGKVYTGDDEVRVYLESLRLYITLPWNLKKFPIALYAGSSRILGSEYETIYFTSVQVEASPDVDQYVAYLDKKTGALEWIEFTYRELFSFYRGILKFGYYEPWNDKQYPRRITILDKFGDSDFVHEIRIERMEFPKLPMEEADKVLEPTE